ncbi:MAG: hypothetical protein Kow00114_23450 [Kiloniellaceae bacterium]
MQIDWWTLALQAINFLILVWLLQRFLYKPVKAVIEKRKQRAEAAFAEAAEQKRAAEAAQQRYEEERRKLAGERQEMLKKVHAELEAEREKIVAAAKQEAEGLLKDAREAVATERAAVLAEIREEVAGLAVDLAAQVLRKTGGGGGGLYLEQLEKRLMDMPGEERTRLKDDLAAEGAGLEVVTAAPLAAEERSCWTERLGACLGHPGAIRFIVEPEILGGAELRFPHAVLKLTWADQLAKAKDLLRHDEAAS